MTQGTWIALVAVGLFFMNVIAKGDLPNYKAVLFGSGQATTTPSPTNTGNAAATAVPGNTAGLPYATGLPSQMTVPFSLVPGVGLGG